MIDFVTITLERELADGTEIRTAITSTVHAIENLSCPAGDWFESVLRDLKSRLNEEQQKKEPNE